MIGFDCIGENITPGYWILSQKEMEYFYCCLFF